MNDEIDVKTLTEVINDFSTPKEFGVSLASLVNVADGCADKIDWTVHAGDIIHAYHINDPVQAVLNAVNECSCDCNYKCTCNCAQCRCDSASYCRCNTDGWFSGSHNPCACNINVVKPCSCDTYVAPPPTNTITYSADNNGDITRTYVVGSKWKDIKRTAPSMSEYKGYESIGWTLNENRRGVIQDDKSMRGNVTVYPAYQPRYCMFKKYASYGDNTHNIHQYIQISAKEIELYRMDGCKVAYTYSGGGAGESYIKNGESYSSEIYLHWAEDSGLAAEFIDLDEALEYIRRGTLRDTLGNPCLQIGVHSHGKGTRPEVAFIMPSMSGIAWNCSKTGHFYRPFYYRTYGTSLTKSMLENSKWYGDGEYYRLTKDRHPNCNFISKPYTGEAPQFSIDGDWSNIIHDYHEWW